MFKAKDIVVKRIPSSIANSVTRKYHYSHKVVNNSQVHFGVFLNGKIQGAMSFGCPIAKSNVIGLVKGTAWNDMLELNRMAFSDVLPKNSESRALGIALREIKKHAPHIKWILSFADATQCGDGTIYRATGFHLTGFSSGSMYELPEDLAKINGGPYAHRLALQCKSSNLSREVMKRTGGKNYGSREYCEKLGMKVVPGFMIRYIYFLHPEEKQNLTVPILPFSEIDRRQAGMYRGSKRVASIGDDAAINQIAEGGSSPTATLQEV